MADTRTIARPYAQAVFELAREHNTLDKWADMLATGSRIMADPALHALVGDPRVGHEQLVEIVLGAADDRIDEQGANFIRLLAENDRLNVLPEITELYETYRREAEKTIEAQVVTAFPLSEAQQQQVSAALEKQLGHHIVLSQTVDESLLGGMMIRIGDRVIDGSVTSQLSKLAQSLGG